MAQHAQHATPVMLSFAKLSRLAFEHGYDNRMLELLRSQRSIHRLGLSWIGSSSRVLLSRFPAEISHPALPVWPALSRPLQRQARQPLSSLQGQRLFLRKLRCMAEDPVDLTSGPDEQLWAVEQELQEVMLRHLTLASAAQLLS